jgi:predicted nucleic acid-binding Zn ribbon protein
MKACLNCQKEYQNKREASKFCSDKCRVAYNRKHPRQKVTPLQMQVLYNTMLEMFGKMGQAPQSAATPQKQAFMAPIQQPMPQVNTQVIMQKYVEDRREVTCQEEFQVWSAKLQADNRLSSKQKELVLNTH